MGRIDDVLNVSGHRLGTMEIESALVAHPLVAEAAVVGKPHEIRGEVIVAFVVLRESCLMTSRLPKLLKLCANGFPAKLAQLLAPKKSDLVKICPKRVLVRSCGASCAPGRGETITQDISTLENPVILEQFSQTI